MQSAKKKRKNKKKNQKQKTEVYKQNQPEASRRLILPLTFHVTQLSHQQTAWKSDKKRWDNILGDKASD